MDDESLQQVYCWVDDIALSRPKRNISRDFSDGVLMAEIVSSYFPRIVELHNYSAANLYVRSYIIWNTLNTKFLKKSVIKYHKRTLTMLLSAFRVLLTSFIF